MTGRTRLTIGVTIALVVASVSLRLTTAQGQRADVAPRAEQGSSRPGQTTTLLPDGRWLVLGGQTASGTTASAAIVDPQTGQISPLNVSMSAPRAGHTATVMPDGTVLVIGGRNGHVPIEIPERFDPATDTFTSVVVSGSVSRAYHSATLLSDGRVVVAGGNDEGLTALPTEMWDLGTGTATAMASGIGRFGHSATLLGDGRVLLTGGVTADGQPAGDAVVINPQTAAAVTVRLEQTPPEPPKVTASVPTAGATDVPVDTRLALQFSDALAIATLTNETITVTGPEGPRAARIIAAEQGRLAFIWPAESLADATTYTVRIAGAMDPSGVQVAPVSLTFTTAARSMTTSDAKDEETWVPNAGSVQNGWRTNRPPSPWESLAPLTAPPGVTALSGRVLTLDGRPLADVTLAVEGDATTRSDRTGRFLLVLKSGSTARRVLQIDGRTASRPTRQYGFYEYGLTVTGGMTTVLPFTIWQPKLDTAHQVTVPSPTTTEVMVTTPFIPGLELHLPAGTSITGEDGKPVTTVGLTAIPVDRPPFPLARNVDVPVYFTAQPGGAYVQTPGPGPRGAWLVYPNYRNGVPGQRTQFFHYDPDVRGWYVYGVGRVTPNGTQVRPDPTTRIYAFTGAMINTGSSRPNAATNDAPQNTADPIDPSTGLFVMRKTDLYLPDVMPLALTRTYNSGDGLNRSFGFGMQNPYAMFLWSAQQYQQADLVRPDGSMIHYVRTSPGTSWADAVFTASATPTVFYQSTIVWNGDGWNLTLKDGTVYVFGENAPLQAIRDRYGNTVTITHDSGQSGNVTKVTSPNGRWIAFTYDGSNRVTQAKDNIGRTVGYTYDANGNLSTVTDPATNVTTYTYDTSHQLLTIKDGRQIVYLTNTYVNGRIATQTLADPTATYQFAYTVDGSGNITQTDVTDPRGNIERLAFNANHYVVSDTQAYSTALARTTTTTRQSGSNLVTAIVDGLSRRTEYTYDSVGNVLTTTRLAGTADAVTTTITYEPLFNQVATVTDPLSHTWTLGYDAQGRLTSLTDPLTHATTLTPNAAGQVTSVTDALQHTTQFGYTGGDLTSVTDPLNAVQRRFIDAAGRLILLTDPLGRQTRSVVDSLNRVTTVTDALGGQTAFAYDPNSNLTSLTDALTHPTTYTYDTSDRVATRTDPLQKSASYVYDVNSNVTRVTDRKGQATRYQYDALDRRTLATYDDGSTTQYVYDAGDRLTQIVDSVAGTITRGYDLLDRVTSETTPEGSLSYTYDAAGRRATMTVAGQTGVNYTYDNANRLTSITQGPTVVALTYDDANRRSTLTLPNGILATYGYDNASHLTSLAYTLNGNPVGDLSYTYDAAGQRTSVGGSWARTGLPQAVASATYDAANRIQLWGGQVFTYDANGNLASEGLTSYIWNARNQLTSLSGATSASFQYDAVGRRRGKTISGTTTNFLYDDLNFVQELSSGAPSANLLTGLGIDQTFARTDGSGTSTLLTDALLSTAALANASGTVQTQYTFDPFGATVISGTTDMNTQQFTGREDDNSGLYYYRARYYSAGSARFISEDPLDDGTRIRNLLRSKDVSSPYAYAQDNPLKWGDPEGTAPEKITFPPWVSGNWLPWLNTNQDGRCTVPLVGGAMDRNPCIKGCCEVHDECYELFGCNMSTWSQSSGVCTWCNMFAVKCVFDSLRDPKKRTGKCQCK